MDSKKNRISIRLALGTLLVITTAITIAFSVSIQYYFLKNSELSNSLMRYQNISSQVRSTLSQLDSAARGIVDESAISIKLIDKVTDEGDLLLFMTTVLKHNPNIYSVYIANDNEDLFQVINLNSANVRSRLYASADERWLRIKHQGIGKSRVKESVYYDGALNLKRKTIAPSSFLPSQRPWYQNAGDSSVTKTDPYLFHHLSVTGQTYSKRIQGSGAVFAVDYTLSTIESYFDSLDKTTFEAFVFLPDGRITATNRNVDIESKLPAVRPFRLTEAQIELVKNTPVLKVSNQLDWAPIDFAVTGHPQGYAIDIMRMISKLTGLQFEYINGLSWKELVAQFGKGRIDILHSISAGSSISLPLTQKVPLYDTPFAIALRDTSLFKGPEKYQEPLIIGVLDGWTIEYKFRDIFPNAEILKYPTLREALQSLDLAEIDAVLDSELVLLKKIDNLSIEDISVEQIPLELLDSRYNLVLHSGQAGLAELIEQAIESIDEPALAYLENKWRDERIILTHIPYKEVAGLIKREPLSPGIQEVIINGINHYVYIEKVDDEEQQYLSIVIPQSQIMDSVNKKVAFFLQVTLLALLLLLVVVWFIAIPVVRPIKLLEKQSNLIADRKYGELKHIDSHIKEIHRLSRSFTNMARSLEHYEKEQKEFIDSFIQLVADAIDDKSPYTGGHCLRVPELAILLVDKAHQSDLAPFKAFSFKNEDEWREFRVAAWLHDCGKITTPEYVVDKATKLETNYNRIHEIRTRFEVLWRDAEIAALRQKMAPNANNEEIDCQLTNRKKELQEQFAFIANSNIGDEFMSSESQQKIAEIGKQQWMRFFDNTLGLSGQEISRLDQHAASLPARETLLADKDSHIIKRKRDYYVEPSSGINMDIPKHLYNLGEIYNLSIQKGTLTNEERFKINEHMISGIKMLNNIPFPKELERVPRYASTHHETMKGTGYPRKLSGDQLSIPERVLALADIFEALTASDRPYKTAKTIAEALAILHKMALENHIDKDVYRLFVETKVYQTYAEAYLCESQIDEVDEESLLRGIV